MEIKVCAKFRLLFAFKVTRQKCNQHSKYQSFQCIPLSKWLQVLNTIKTVLLESNLFLWSLHYQLLTIKIIFRLIPQKYLQARNRKWRCYNQAKLRCLLVSNHDASHLIDEDYGLLLEYWTSKAQFVMTSKMFLNLSITTNHVLRNSCIFQFLQHALFSKLESSQSLL